MSEKETTQLPLAENAVGQGLLLTTLALLCLGVVMVHSAVASVAKPGLWYSRVDFRHTVFAVLSAIVVLTAWRMNFQWFNTGKRRPTVAIIMLAGSLLLGTLVFVPGIGFSVGGFHRWIRLGPRQYSIGFQPSELIKICLVIYLAAWLSRERVNPKSFFRTFVPALILIAVCMGLVITQDFGTAMLIAISSGVALLLAGVPWWYLGSLVATAAVGAFFFVVQNPYRWSRVQAMLNPWDETNKASFQARESLYAIISGGWTGTGLGNGMIKQGYLPEDSTDFIFSVFCEEWGFLGAMLLMGLLLLWIVLAYRAAMKSQDPFGRVLVGALGFLIAVQAVLHMAVDLVVAPPKGLGLPFVSAGGTSLIIMAAAVAAMVSVTARPAGGLRET